MSNKRDDAVYGKSVACPGFSLIEVLVALAIVSIALLAIGQQFTQQTQIFEQNQSRILAQWAAHNQLNTLYARQAWPEVGSSDIKINLAGQEWHLQQQVTSTSNANIKRIDYLLADPTGRRLGSLLGYISKP